MSTETNIAAVRRFRDGLNAGNFDEADAVLANTLVVHMGSDPNPLNKESFVQLGRVSWSAFSGFTTTIEDIVAEGDKVVSRVTFLGTHTGDMMGIPPTGKSITISEIIIDQLAHWSEVKDSGELSNRSCRPRKPVFGQQERGYFV